ncbi:helix-turn-helix domain-containing protein [Microcella indica]|jgi:excisionase family DNA binding protein|uniref:helix-turn-helix domain-containing protein n=1 Tax=Microcella indica TaxID=2750620 RepID=UPI0015CF367A|nr:helix-turn-helix domain-containing protein [Microcella indica]
MPDDPLNPIGRFVTLADVAEILSLSAAEVLALVRSGELPAIRLGSIGQWRVESSVLESFIADKYDEAKRMALWNEAEFADVAEIFPDHGRNGQRRTSST